MKSIKTFAVLVSLLALFVADAACQSTIQIVFPTTSDWLDTGYDLFAGERVIIVAYGRTVRDSSPAFTKDASNWVGPEGDPRGYGPVIESLPSCALLGKIGETGSPFSIGGYFSFLAEESGRLYLGVNDSPTSDNAGFLLAVIYCQNSVLAMYPSAVEDTPAIPATLHQNYPNPFNPLTNIDFAILEKSRVKISIYSVEGELIRVLTDEVYPQGNHSVVWDGKNGNGNTISSGVYYYSLAINDKVLTSRKAVMLR